MSDGTDKVAARMTRIEKRVGYAEREARHFEQWEKQVARRKQIWSAELFDREHECLMAQAVEASRAADS